MKSKPKMPKSIACQTELYPDSTLHAEHHAIEHKNMFHQDEYLLDYKPKTRSTLVKSSSDHPSSNKSMTGPSKKELHSEHLGKITRLKSSKHKLTSSSKESESLLQTVSSNAVGKQTVLRNKRKDSSGTKHVSHSAASAAKRLKTVAGSETVSESNTEKLQLRTYTSGTKRKQEMQLRRSGADNKSISSDELKYNKCVSVKSFQDISCSDPKIDSTTECDDFGFDGGDNMGKAVGTPCKKIDLSNDQISGSSATGSKNGRSKCNMSHAVTGNKISKQTSSEHIKTLRKGMIEVHSKSRKGFQGASSESVAYLIPAQNKKLEKSRQLKKTYSRKCLGAKGTKSAIYSVTSAVHIKSKQTLDNISDVQVLEITQNEDLDRLSHEAVSKVDQITKVTSTEHKGVASNGKRSKKGRSSSVLQSDRVLRRRPVSCSEVPVNCQTKSVVKVNNLETKGMKNTPVTETSLVNLAKHSQSRSAVHLGGKKIMTKARKVRFSQRLKPEMAAMLFGAAPEKTETKTLATCSETGEVGNEKVLTSVTLVESSSRIKTNKSKSQRSQQDKSCSKNLVPVTKIKKKKPKLVLVREVKISPKKGTPAPKIKKTIVADDPDIDDQTDSDNSAIWNNKMETGDESVVLDDQHLESSDPLSPHLDADTDDGSTHADCEISSQGKSPSVGDDVDLDPEESGLSCHRLFTYSTEYNDCGSSPDLQSFSDSFTLNSDLSPMHNFNFVSTSTPTDCKEYRGNVPISSTRKTYVRKRLVQQMCDSSCQTDVSLSVQSENLVTEEASSSIAFSYEDQDKNNVEGLIEETLCGDICSDMNIVSGNLSGGDTDVEDVYEQVPDPATDESLMSDFTENNTEQTGRTQTIHHHEYRESPGQDGDCDQCRESQGEDSDCDQCRESQGEDGDCDECRESQGEDGAYDQCRESQGEESDCDECRESQGEDGDCDQMQKVDTDETLESSHDSCGSQNTSPDCSMSQESSQDDDKSTSPFGQKRRKHYCLTDITSENILSVKTRSFSGSRLRGSSGWEESLRPRPAKTEILQVGSNHKSPKHKKNERAICSSAGQEKQGKEDTELILESAAKKSRKQQSCDSKSESTTKKRRTDVIVLENDRQLKSVIENEPNYGKLVWARLAGERWWPGVVIRGSQVYLQGNSDNSSWIFWFGDHKVSQIAHQHIIPFEDGFSSKFNKKVKKPTIEALWECWRRNNSPPELDSEEALLEFATDGFKFSDDSQQNWTFEPPPDEPIPEYVLTRLREIGEEIRTRAASKPYSVETQDTDAAIAAIKSGERKITDVCISCLDLDDPVVCQHPMFEGGLCQQCKEFLMETCYAFAEDGLHAYCTVCGHGGKLFICDSRTCCRVYCFACVEDFCEPQVTANIQASKSWLCFLCTPYEQSTHGLLQPKTDWEQQMITFFDTGYRIERPSLEYFKEKRPIRVLSLFDGIGTCKLALDQLGIVVDVYYSSEVDKDALMVTRANHGDSIIQIGDVQLLNCKSQLPNIGPVDLLIGGSPCNDFSLANPDRKGFGGSGVLFFDFFRVLKYLQINYQDRHLFWLYENVASMKTEYMAHISRFLECQPALWDSKFFTAQHRARYFWGNIPGLYSTPEISTNLHKSVSLDSSLETNCNRQAVIPKLRTVTTRSNSLKFGKKDEYFPIQMDGIDDGIWIPELERVFGFPSHYTDVGNLPTSRRQKLIGKAWCLPVIKNILAPLKEYFTVRDDS